MEHDIKLTWFEALQIKFAAEQQITGYEKLITEADNDPELSKPEYKNHRANLKYYLETWQGILTKATDFTKSH